MTAAIRVAAVGDVHMDDGVIGRFRPALETLPECADLLLLAGDLTRHGTEAEAACVAREFGGLGVPVVAVLGNHDYHCDKADEVMAVLTDAGITVLDGGATTLDVGDATVGIAGTIGFGGGFAGKCVSEFGEPVTKLFAARAREQAELLSAGLAQVATVPFRIALTHYSPVPDTLAGEPPELAPFLGSYLLGIAIDENHATLAVHGHAHHGSPRGRTPGGVPVRNVAHPVLRQAFAVFQLTAKAAVSPSL
jgi:Icc-related predicted phosphoesterase